MSEPSLIHHRPPPIDTRSPDSRRRVLGKLEKNDDIPNDLSPFFGRTEDQISTIIASSFFRRSILAIITFLWVFVAFTLLFNDFKSLSTQSSSSPYSHYSNDERVLLEVNQNTDMERAMDVAQMDEKLQQQLENDFNALQEIHKSLKVEREQLKNYKDELNTISQRHSSSDAKIKQLEIDLKKNENNADEAAGAGQFVDNAAEPLMRQTLADEKQRLNDLKMEKSEMETNIKQSEETIKTLEARDKALSKTVQTDEKERSDIIALEEGKSVRFSKWGNSFADFPKRTAILSSETGVFRLITTFEDDDTTVPTVMDISYLINQIEGPIGYTKTEEKSDDDKRRRLGDDSDAEKDTQSNGDNKNDNIGKLMPCNLKISLGAGEQVCKGTEYLSSNVNKKDKQQKSEFFCYWKSRILESDDGKVSKLSQDDCELCYQSANVNLKELARISNVDYDSMNSFCLILELNDNVLSSEACYFEIDARFKVGNHQINSVTCTQPAATEPSDQSPAKSVYAISISSLLLTLSVSIAISVLSFYFYPTQSFD